MAFFNLQVLSGYNRMRYREKYNNRNLYESKKETSMQLSIDWQQGSGLACHFNSKRK